MAVPTLLLMETLKSPSTKNKSPWESHSQVYTNLCGLQSRKQVEITDLGFFFFLEKPKNMLSIGYCNCFTQLARIA